MPEEESVEGNFLDPKIQNSPEGHWEGNVAVSDDVVVVAVSEDLAVVVVVRFHHHYQQ